MNISMLRHWTLKSFAVALSAMVFLTGCGGQSDVQFLDMGTAPIGGAFYPVGTALSEVLNNHSDGKWKVTAKATSGTRENIRKLDRGDMDLALANASITFHAVRGIEGFQEKSTVKTIMTLAPNVGHFVTLKNSDIKTIADFKGKRIGTGPAGAGFEYFLKPVLAAHGVGFDDFTPLNNTQSGLVDLLADGSADAIFLGGAMPHPSITQACSSLDVYFIPYDTTARAELVEQYTFINPITVRSEMYSDLEQDFEGLNVGSIQLITSADADEELIYQVTQKLWENRDEVAKKHGVGKAINEQNAARYTGTDFHPGAIRLYKEIEIWQEPEPAAAKQPNVGA